MSQQIDRVFDATGSLQWTRIDRHTQCLGQLLPVELLRLACQLDGAFQESKVEIGGDEAVAEFHQRALREHRLRGAQAVQNHLPSQIDRKSTRLNSSHVKISYAV